MSRQVTLLRTPLYDQHCQAGAQLVDFSGWEMPLHYGSQIDEHHQVRNSAGIFDVSHMGVVDIEGQGAVDYLRYLLANDVQKLKEEGQALYTCMLNDAGGVVDDLIVYRMADEKYRLVINAGTRQKDLAWMNEHVGSFDVTITERKDLSILAVQGPKVLSLLENVFSAELAQAIELLKPFKFVISEEVQIARTGYTGEDGIEMVLPADQAAAYWQKFIAAGVKPCGLGARDTLRLEAGLNLYGSDMSEEVSPLVSNLAWTISWKDEKRHFIGRAALKEQLASGILEQLVGIVMEDRGVLRDHQTVTFDGNGEGTITSGGFSPTLGHAIALARVPKHIPNKASVERRGKAVPVTVVKPPFVRHGQKVYS